MFPKSDAMQRQQDDASSNGIAAIFTDISRFVFAEVSSGQVAVEDYSVLAHAIEKVFSKLESSQCKMVLVDVDALISEPEDIAEKLTGLKAKTKKPIIIFAKARTPEDDLINVLRMSGFQQFVIAPDLTNMKQQMRECLDGAKNFLNIWQQKKNEEVANKGETKVYKTIGFVGTTAHIGTTTQAIQFAMLLLALRYRVCYVDMAGHGQVQVIAERMTPRLTDIHKGYIEFQGLDMYFKPIKITENIREQYHVVVYDYGTWSEENEQSFIDCDVRVCVGKPDPWTKDAMKTVVNRLDKERTLFVLPFIPKKQWKPFAAQNAWLSRRHQLFFSAYAPDMYVYPNANKKMYYYFLKALALEEKRTFAVVYWEKFREFLQRTRLKISAKISEMRKKKTRGPKAGKVHIKTPANQMPQSTHTETIQTFTDTRAGDTEELTPQSLGVPLSAVATGATIPSVAVQDAAANT